MMNYRMAVEMRKEIEFMGKMKLKAWKNIWVMRKIEQTKTWK